MKNGGFKFLFHPQILKDQFIRFPSALDLLFWAKIASWVLTKRNAMVQQCFSCWLFILYRFVRNQFKDLYSEVLGSLTPRSLKRWEKVEAKICSQLELRIFSCLQIASKFIPENSTDSKVNISYFSKRSWKGNSFIFYFPLLITS